MKFYTILFPLATLLLAALTARGWLPLFAEPERLPDEAPPPKKRLCFRAPMGRLTGRDALCMAVITLIYAAVAFVNLGDATAPHSECRFDKRGEYALIELSEETELSGVRYFTSLHTGEYRLEFSADGETFWDVATMEQHYDHLFKWRRADLDTQVSHTAKYIRITADDELWLGELALYAYNGKRIDAATLSYPEGCAPLFDEQDTVAEQATYMNGSYFDEIYHARTAYEHLEGVWPYEITHPPLGKIIISLGILLFGMTPFGWRFSGTLFGCLMLPLLYIFLKRMFDDKRVAVCGTVIFAFDFMHFVQTRIATIDTYSVFFILLMYLFMYRFVAEERPRDLALSGLFFGLGAASKWTCIYAGGGLAVIWLLYWISRRREEDFLRKFLGNVVFCLFFFVAVPCAVYYASYIPYGVAKGMSGVAMLVRPEYADIVIDNQLYMWNYHSDLVATHPYSSRWYQWLCDARPILYYLNSPGDGTRASIGAILSPLLCWGGLAAMLGVFLLSVKDRDGKSIFIAVGYLAQLLPWVVVSRLTFAYHYFPSSLFLVLALCLMFNGARRKNPGHTKYMYLFTGVSVVLFALFYPVLSGVTVPLSYSGLVQWMGSWPF